MASSKQAASTETAYSSVLAGKRTARILGVNRSLTGPLPGSGYNSSNGKCGHLAVTTGWCGVAFDEGETGSGEIERAKPAGAAPAFAREFRKAVGTIASPERELTRKLLELSRSGDTAQSVGYRAPTGKPIASPHALQAKRRREEDDRFTLRTAQQILEARLAAIEARLHEIDKRLEKIEEELGAIDEIERLRAIGALDPRNAEHAALLRSVGITPEEAETKDITPILLDRRDALAGEREGLQREQQGLRDERSALRDTLEDDLDDPATSARIAALDKPDDAPGTAGQTPGTPDRRERQSAAPLPKPG